jgi:hypothetical protein
MPDAVVYVAMVLGCSLAAVGGARLLGSRMWLGGVIADQVRDDGPPGIREADTSPVAAARTDPAQPGPSSDVVLTDDIEAAPAAAEIVELHVRGYTRPGDPRRH